MRADALTITVAILLALPVRSGAQTPSLDDALARAARYITRLHEQSSGLVAEEVYRQRIRATVDGMAKRGVLQQKTLKSDLLFVKPANTFSYVEFRDVFEVDGEPVRDRQERLTRLFLSPPPANQRQLTSIISESARHNIGDIPRNINTPLLTLSFLQPAMQSRFRFRRARGAQPHLDAEPLTAGGDTNVFRVTTEMWVIEFHESKRPTVIRTNSGRDFPAAGRFWMNPDTGAVLMSELEMDNGQVSATINVSYQSEPLLGFLVPVEMRERYHAQGVRVEREASYGRFRQFQVTTSEVIGKPPGAQR